MKSCLFILALATVALQGQDQPRLLLPKLDPERTQALKQKLFDWSLTNAQPGNAWSSENAPGWTQSPKQKWFAWPTSQPESVVNLGAEPLSATCAVPLIEVPVDQNIDSRMVRKARKSRIDDASVVKGIPPCPERR